MNNFKILLMCSFSSYLTKYHINQVIQKAILFNWVIKRNVPLQQLGASNEIDQIRNQNEQDNQVKHLEKLWIFL